MNVNAAPYALATSSVDMPTPLGILLPRKTEPMVTYIRLDRFRGSPTAVNMSPMRRTISDPRRRQSLASLLLGSVVLIGSLFGSEPTGTIDPLPIDIDRAEVTEWTLIQGIGPTLAQRIVAVRDRSEQTFSREDILGV